jgi:hypothetical protein
VTFKSESMVDAYTKLLLTIIAVSLSVITFRTSIQSASALNDCGDMVILVKAVPCPGTTQIHTCPGECQFRQSGSCRCLGSDDPGIHNLILYDGAILIACVRDPIWVVDTNADALVIVSEDGRPPIAVVDRNRLVTKLMLELAD